MQEKQQQQQQEKQNRAGWQRTDLKDERIDLPDHESTVTRVCDLLLERDQPGATKTLTTATRRAVPSKVSLIIHSLKHYSFLKGLCIFSDNERHSL